MAKTNNSSVPAFGMIDDGDTADGQATFKCYNKKPTIDLTVGLKGV